MLPVIHEYLKTHHISLDQLFAQVACSYAESEKWRNEHEAFGIIPNVVVAHCYGLTNLTKELKDETGTPKTQD
jgi:hypothetical protein